MAKTYDTDSKLESQELSSWHHPEAAARREQGQGAFPGKLCVPAQGRAQSHGNCPTTLIYVSKKNANQHSWSYS